MDNEQNSTMDTVKQAARNTAEETKEAAKEKAREIKTAAKDTAKELYQDGKAEAEARAAEAHTRAATEAQATADAMRRAGRDFDDGDIRHQAAMHIADGIGSVADHIRAKNLSDIPGDLRTLARDNPVLFFAGAAAAGFAVARLMKASERDRAEVPPVAPSTHGALAERPLPPRPERTGDAA